MGFFIKGSARIVTPPYIFYKGFKVKYFFKGDIVRMIYFRQKYRTKRIDGSTLYTKNNTGLILKKRQDTQSKYFYGPAIRQLNRKRFLILFKKII
jgi:ribosomal protein L14